MKWNDAKNNPPKIEGRWSMKDYFLCCRYSHDIGRMRDGVWVNMDNKPVDVILWMEIPEIQEDHKVLF